MSSRPATDSGKEAVRLRGLFGGETAERAGMWVASIELEASALTLDAAREHMACACDGIEGHLAVRGLLPEPTP